MVLTCHFFWSFCKLDAELTEKKCLQWCAFYHPRIKPVLQQMGFLQVAKSCCKKKRVVALFVTKTCSAFYCPKANVTILPRMASLPSNFIQSEDGIHPTTWFVARQVYAKHRFSTRWNQYRRTSFPFLSLVLPQLQENRALRLASHATSVLDHFLLSSEKLSNFLKVSLFWILLFCTDPPGFWSVNEWLWPD